MSGVLNSYSTKFYQQDIVQKINPPYSVGIVLRCWHDAEDTSTPNLLYDPLMRALKQGEVGASFLSGDEREILPESELRLIDRTFQQGDFCKRSIEDVQSGVIANVQVRGRLVHVISGESVGWRKLSELERKADAEIGDYVVYDDWIGQVIELYDESIVELPNGQLVRLPELSSRLSVGDKGTDILPPPPSGVTSLFGLFVGPQNGPGTVIAIEHTVYAIAWLAVNQSLDVATAQSKLRPQRFWFGEDISKLTIIRGRSDLEMRVGDRVCLSNSTNVPFTTHGQGNDPTITVQTFTVVETETTVDVLWQDGVHELVKSTDVIPYLNPDEYDCWPGDHVVWKTEDTKRPAIVQYVNAEDRTARVYLPDTGIEELASVLELDPHGMSDSVAVIPQSASEGLGVRRGDFVFIHREGSTNGFDKPFVPRIGELESWVREEPFFQGILSGWRKEMSDIGSHLAATRGAESATNAKKKMKQAQEGSFLWLGEVTTLNIDGTVEVTHPDWTVKSYTLDRLTKLYDGIEQLEDDLWSDEASGSHESAGNEEVWSMNEDGTWQFEADSNEWEELNDEDENGMDTDHPGWADDVPGQEPTATSPLESSSPHPSTQREMSQIDEISSQPTQPIQDTENSSNNQGGDLPWKRFDILPSVPRDHAFFTSNPAQPSKTFLGRLTREYRVLSNSLPDTIIVRAYEDRTDLLRCLILGPSNTPYEDAPFLIDWMLDSNFPHSPPIAHFHSWTNGNGRVNPNLYEEGKVCLSILGTWAGDKNEIWNGARSSLLQAFISIQGLVLVKEPWFCEPAYEKLRGTEEGIVNSRLYNEKAFVLSRGFVRRALEVPLGGLEAEVNWIYYKKCRLQKVVHDAITLIRKSTSTPNPDIATADHDLAVPRLTAGGIITLERTLKRLQSLLNSGPVT